MANVTEYLEQLQKLTQQNLDILKTLNESFYTNKEHLSVEVNNTKYVIPSFMMLENKINYLQEGFDNLISAPENGEAHFNFDGNSRTIEVKKYTEAPNGITLPNVSTFSTETNNIFKDFLTPNPYIHFDLSKVPNDITSVVVKKIIPNNSELLEIFSSKLVENQNINLTSKQEAYKDLYKILALYKKDVDYTEYDTIMKMPIHQQSGFGVYAIQEITADYTDELLDQYVTFKLRNDLKGAEYMNKLYYRLFNETIERRLEIGDELVSYDGKTKFKITNLLPASNLITVKVLNGEYINLSGCKDIDEKYITEISKLKFYSPINFDEDKYINIPLEEDKYIYIAISPLNDRMNIQAPWGTGLYINTYLLKNNKNQMFNDFYVENVKNIGDILNEISSSMYNSISKFNEGQFNRFVNLQPKLEDKDLQVIQINSHLNDNKTIQEIRSLYSQKLKYKTELAEIQKDIDNYNQQLSSISFDDTTNTRSGLVTQIDTLNKRKNELMTSMTKVIDNISMTANNSEVPIENAKYRIRGYFDYQKFEKINKLDGHIIGIKVQYRYKNSTLPQGSSLSMNNGDFLFSDWQDMKSFLLQKEPKFDGTYKFEYPEDNSTKNEPSFNQIDIPITQGETVDIRLKVVYDYGYPFVQTTSIWSEILNIAFPQELLKNVQVLTIIEENNSDIETNRFSNILNNEGIPSHVDDKIIDQDITYFHKPENIASGFYTAERRIIPLKDKLMELDSNIADLLNEVTGSDNSNLSLFAEIAGSKQELYPYNMNNIPVESYNTFIGDSKKSTIDEGVYTIDGDKISVVINLTLMNTSNKTIKLYPLFPGNREIAINDIKQTKFDKNDYSLTENNEKYGVGFQLNGNLENLLVPDIVKPGGNLIVKAKQSKIGNPFDQTNIIPSKIYPSHIQTANQFITFRIKDAIDGTEYYKKDAKYTDINVQNLISNGKKISLDKNEVGAVLYPFLINQYALCNPGDSKYAYYPLEKNETITIPLIFEYNLNNSKLDFISKIISFDIRTSLYSDPINYNIKVTAKKQNSILDNMLITDKIAKYTKYKTVAGLNE